MIRIHPIALMLMMPAVVLAQELPSAEEYLGHRMPLSLRQAELLALQNNLDLELARAEPAIAEQALAGAGGAFDPEMSADYRYNRNENPVASSLEGAGLSIVGEDEWNYSGGVGGILPWGLSYSSSLNQRRLESGSKIVSLAREWRATWRNQITLPLLKDLMHNEASVAVKRARVARDVSIQEFGRQLSDILLGVEQAYWELSASRAAEGVALKSLETAQDLLEQTRVQYQVGVVSRVSVTQAEAGVAEREVQAIEAANRASAAQDQMLQQILAPDAPRFEGTELIPEEPTFIEYQVDLETAMERALRSRPEIESARKQVEDAEIQLAFARNQRLPSLNLTGVFQFDGLSGKPKPADQILFGGTLPDLGEATDAFSKFFKSGGADSWEAGAHLSIPLGNRAARALVTQRRIELRRARTSLRQAEQNIILEVRDAVRNLHSAVEALEAARRRRVAQEETLRAEQEKLRLGDSTPHDVLEFDEDLAEAKRQEILAHQSYRNAITQLERDQATLLASRHIQLEEELAR